jgi:hypothetical protein
VKSFKQEPILYITAAVAILMFVKDFIAGEITIGSLDAALVALSGLLGRKYVSPVANKE